MLREQSITADLERLVSPILEAGGLELVEASCKQGRGRALVQVFIDKPGGVTLDDCQDVSRELSAVLDVEDIIQGAYSLEVSSPGLDRPLKTARDFGRNIGRMLKVKYKDAERKQRALTGRLTGVDGSAITVAVEEGEVVTIAIADIVKAVLQIEF